VFDGTPSIIFAAAFVPALAWAVLVGLVLRHASRRIMAMAFVWGAGVAAPVSWYVAGGWQLGPVVGGPIVEELLKAVPLVLLALGPASVLDLIACGLLVGLGFAATENAHYLVVAAVQGGHEGLARGVYLRGALQGLNHAVFTGATGAGFALARVAPTASLRALAAGLGLVLAVAQHSLWNGLVSGAVTHAICNATAAGAACREPDAVDLLVTTPLLVVAGIGPGLVMLLAVVRRMRRRERRTLASAPSGT
jgi:RsiW-degrading membrane proteinase PrsW (M82 family)